MCAGCRVQGAGCRLQGAGCRVQGAGCRVQGARCRMQGAASEDQPGIGHGGDALGPYPSSCQRVKFDSKVVPGRS